MAVDIEKHLPSNMLSANRSAISALRRRNRALRIATGRRPEDMIGVAGDDRETKTHEWTLHPTKGWRCNRK